MFVTGAGDLGPTSLSELDGSVVSLYESDFLAGTIQLVNYM